VSGGEAPEVIGELREILARATGREELLGVAAQAPLFGAGVGLDSLTGTLLLREVHRRFGVMSPARISISTRWPHWARWPRTSPNTCPPIRSRGADGRWMYR